MMTSEHSRSSGGPASARKVGYNAGLSRRRSRVRVPSAPQTAKTQRNVTEQREPRKGPRADPAVPSAGGVLPANAPTLADLSARHLELIGRTCARHTLVAYEQSWRLVLLPMLGPGARLGALSRLGVREAHAEYGAQYPAAANRALTVLRSAWPIAEDLGWIDRGRNPASNVRKLPELRRQNPIEPDQAAALRALVLDCIAEVATVVPRTMAAGYALILSTGARRTAAFNLRTADFDLPHAEVTIHGDKTTSRRGPQRLALGPLILGVLTDYLPTIDSDWAFPSDKTGRPWREVNRPWRRLCDEAGVAGATIRDVRTGIATAAFAAGEELRAIQHHLHHASITTTARYARVTPKRAHEAAARMERALLEDDDE